MARNAGWCLAVLIGSLPVVAAAQSSAPVDSNSPHPIEAEGSDALEEVTVTARRRIEHLSDVPISITAIDANQLTERTIRSESDLQLAVPGLIVRTTAVSTQQNYSIQIGRAHV